MEDDDNIYDKVTKHDEIIAANLGDDYALERVKDLFFTGGISKEAYAAALRGHQAAVNATKSDQRDAAERYYERRSQKSELDRDTMRQRILPMTLLLSNAAAVEAAKKM